MMKIDMSVNREPSWLDIDEEIERWEKEGHDRIVKILKDAKENSITLRDWIIQTVESEGQCQLYWRGVSEKLHSLYAKRWAEAMPEYEFEIDEGFKCFVKKR